MKQKLLLCVMLLYSVLFTDCSSSFQENYSTTYEELMSHAIDQNSKFCIVLIDEKFQIDKYVNKVIINPYKNRALWTFIDVNNKANEWFKFLLGTSKTPFTLIFNENGKLENVTYGISKYACISIWNSLSTKESTNTFKNFGFLENSVIDSNTTNITEQLNNIIRIRNDSDLTDEERLCLLNSLIKNIDYPYSHYLKILALFNQSKKDSLNMMINSFIHNYSNSFYISIYAPLFEQLNNLKDKSVNCSELKIQTWLNNTQYQVSDTIKIEVCLSNKTTENIIINRIEPSCNCIKIADQKNTVISPNKSHTFKFYMIADEIGSIYREIYFYTNTCVPYIANFKIHVNR